MKLNKLLTAALLSVLLSACTSGGNPGPSEDDSEPE